MRSDPRLGKIVAFSSSKQLGGPSGQWSLTIKKPRISGPRSLTRSPPDGLWRDPEDVWVNIKVSVDGQVIDTILGLVDSITEDTTRTGSGQRAETYTIQGRDIGKIFEMTPLFVNYFHDPTRPIRSQGAIIAAQIDELVGTPAHFVRLLVETWLGNEGTAEVPWRLPPGLGGGPFFSPNITAVQGGFGLRLEGSRLTGVQPQTGTVHGVAIAPSLLQIDQSGGGHLWDTLQEYCNPLMNELFVDLAPAERSISLESMVPVLTLRERPFPIRAPGGSTTDKSRWNRLQTWELDRGDIKRRNVVKGGAASRFNYWKLRLNGMGSEGFNVDEILQRGVDGVESGQPGNIPIFNAESISRHGVRPYTAQTRFIPFFYRNRADPEDATAVREQERLQGSFFRLVAAWLKKVHDWYVVAPFELSGTLQTSRMQPEIRIGHRVVERRNEGVITYYVEGVAHRWSYPNEGETTLTVTRGEYEDDELLDSIYESGFEAPQALTEREACFVDEDADLSDNDLIEALAAGCAFRSPPAGEVLTDLQQVEQGIGEELTLDEFRPGESGFTELAAERDGTVPVQQQAETPVRDGGFLEELELPEVGNEEAIPVPDAPSDPGDIRGQLERHEPLELLEGLDDAETVGGDPIAGLDLTGEEV